jgi:hypothetical protein
MAELTVLDEKLAEVLGLAQAAQQATKRVAAIAKQEREEALVGLLKRMSDEAGQVEERCQAVADKRMGLRTAIADQARDTKSDLVEFMKTYLEEAEALDGLEFLSMAEAGELAHWRILERLNVTARQPEIAKLVSFALPLQEQHVSKVADASIKLADSEDPAGAA